MKTVDIHDLHVVHREIFNGEKEGLNGFEYFLELDKGMSIGLKAKNFNANYFYKLKEIFDKSMYDQLIALNSFQRSSLAPDLILGSYNFPVYFQIVGTPMNFNEYLIFVSYGERNKGIYSFVLESYVAILLNNR